MGRKRKEYEKAESSAAACPLGHLLERHVAVDGEYECDHCRSDLVEGACFFGCSPCDYSLCGGCYIKVATAEVVVPARAGAAFSNDPDAVRIVDPDVADLCEHYDVEDRIMLLLDSALRARPTTFSSDILKLWEELGFARSPSGLLMAKIKQMHDGTFVGKVKAPKELQRVIDKYRLDADARTKLMGFLSSRPETFNEDLFEIERRLTTSNNPSATVMMMIVKLHRGEKLPEPLRGTPHRDFADFPAAPPSRRRGRSPDEPCRKER